MGRARLTGAVAGLSLLLASAAHAATINVTTTGDPGPAGTVSLRQAIAGASAGDTVSVAPGHYTLALGQIPVPNAITISGAGASTTIVDANHASRAFDVTSAGTVAIDNVTITNGSVNISSATTTPAGGGGVLFTHAGGALTLSGDVLSGNAVTGGGSPATNQGGGAVYFDGGTLTVTGSTLTGNSVNLSGPSNNNGGGAIYEDSTTLAVTNSTLSNNSFTIGGAGTTSNNGGGAIYEDDNGLTLSGSTLTGNSASISNATNDNGGGAIYEDGSNPSISSSSVSGNRLMISTATDGNGGGGIYNNGGPLGITSTTVASNSATLTGTTGFNGGGGIFNNGHSGPVVNVTLSDNSLSAPSGTDVGGGGYYDNSSGGTFTNVTVTANQSNQPGGGIFNGVTLALKSSIVAGNSAAAGNANCDGPMSNVSAGNNLEDTTPTTCGFTKPTDLVGTPAGLGPLADNGGPGQTHALLAGSPAIDHIPAAQCTDQQTTPQPLTIDERGVPRSLDGSCDIGAYEFAAADLGVSGSVSPASIVVGQGSTATFNVSNTGPAPATATTMNLTVPAGLKLVSVTPSQGSCTGTTCTLGLLASGGSAHVAVAVTGSQAGVQSISATVSATEPDPTHADNTTAVTISVAAPSLSALKVKPKSFKSHAKVSYTLNVAASVKFTVEVCHRTSGKHHRLKCKKRFSFTINASAGADTLKIKLKLHGHKLSPGSYELVATPQVGSAKGSSRTISFRIL